MTNKEAIIILKNLSSVDSKIKISKAIALACDALTYFPDCGECIRKDECHKNDEIECRCESFWSIPLTIDIDGYEVRSGAEVCQIENVDCGWR